MTTPFDNEKYLKLQKEAIVKRASMFSKLYLEVGGKLFDDLHASRVLPGFESNNKLQILLSLKDESEIVIAINANDIKNRKIRGDLEITYDVEVERLIFSLKKAGMNVNSVAFSFYEPNDEVDKFIKKLRRMKIPTYKQYRINGYPHDTSTIVSENGFGKNEFIKTDKKIIIVTAPGPGSGKMATCLSQLYHENKNGIRAGYAKLETFPVWNLPLDHPVNIAYEAATADLLDLNMIDPFHLKSYGVLAVNYNRDVEVFPLLKNIITTINGECIYNSPTDMGVNMVGFAIADDNAIRIAAKNEIIRRYYEAEKNYLLGKYDENIVEKSKLLMSKVGVSTEDRKCVQAALNKEKEVQTPSMAIELKDGRLICGRRSELLTSSAALLLNSLKALAGINEKLFLLSPNVIEPIISLKMDSLKNSNPKIHAEEILIALAIQANTNPMAELALKEIKNLKGCEAHSSCLLSATDLKTLNKIGINVTEEPQSYLFRK
ncbi:MAG: DUF1846 domain-containing protein [Bacilli bacterium]|nr:DUF1846 domain-containing protein [Bacilli bacterium]